jgi:hypothetical protein
MKTVAAMSSSKAKMRFWVEVIAILYLLSGQWSFISWLARATPQKVAAPKIATMRVSIGGEVEDTGYCVNI